ncbi:hypothetical protein RISINGSUN_21 [Erwinia phage vB_EamM_RisingSun]|uniref:Uncharacterized protein n=1 Tax=Erwinia phage vB_EamM_RisingSun TaxID=2026080 RepID=A0A223LJG1_9CAUD|nr:hypothetical protein FDI45_gp021 [Erwinia phage vB_EamM_RisingSun]ASU03649.1 hypothetical protein RISINGSUN_21 [Erwinia phage vB_EamM_RisingSun]
MPTPIRNPNQANRYTITVQHYLQQWDAQLISHAENVGLGNALLAALVGSAINKQAFDLETWLIDIGVDEVARTYFILTHQLTVEQIFMDLSNFVAVHAVVSWNIVSGTLIMEVI